MIISSPKKNIDRSTIQNYVEVLRDRNYFYTLEPGTTIYRVETEKTKDDRPKFYSYFRDPEACDEVPWLKRCQKTDCTKYTLELVSHLNLLIVPYKMVEWEEEVTTDDLYLETVLLNLANEIYGENGYKDCVKRAISALIDYEEHSEEPCSNLSPDWYLAMFICDLGLDGFIRTVKGSPYTSKTHCYDEITICNPEIVEITSGRVWDADEKKYV